MNYKNIGSCVLFTGFLGLSLCSASCENDDPNDKKKNKKETVDKFYKHMCDLGLMEAKVDDKKDVTYVISEDAARFIEAGKERAKLLLDNKEELKKGSNFNETYSYKEGVKGGIVPKSIKISAAAA